jgi:hypothetical protein
MDLTCPNCHSDSTQRLSAVFESGISTVNNQTRGSGIGLGRGGLAVGVGLASTTGRSQTAISQRAAPPAKKPYLIPVLKIFGAFVVTSVAISALGVALLGFVATLAWIAATASWIYRAAQYNTTTWPLAMQQWQNSFMCHRCNHVFLPNTCTPSD